MSAEEGKVVDELDVLEYEVKDLKKGRKIYKQMPGSQIFFISSKQEVLNDVRMKKEEKANSVKKK